MSVSVIDDAFPELNHVIAEGTKSYCWIYGHTSVGGETNLFFSTVDLLETNLRENLELLASRILHPDEYKLRRVYANGQVMGQEGVLHRDDGDKTALYYPLPWKSEWHGTTEFQNPDRMIEYKQDRLVIFDKQELHRGNPPSIPDILRITIAFKFDKVGN